ncbi:MAG TPA: bilirubin oxidase, partial [Vitreoscilla sp.]|nr:bilirubin oxidase [Vitreoscilla sp.]
MINRRRFLSYGLGVGAAGLAFACNKSAANSDAHSMHGMQNASDNTTSHQNMDHSGHQMGGMNHAANEQDLLPVSALSTGAALAALPLLANESKQAGKFTGRLIAKKHSLKLAKGLESEFWLYNGVLGGPQIVVYEGDEVS